MKLNCTGQTRHRETDITLLEPLLVPKTERRVLLPEVLHGHGETIPNLGIDALVLEVDEVHLLSNLLQGRLGAEGGKISSNVTCKQSEVSILIT